MSKKKVLGPHVRRLMSGISEHAKKHLTEAETDLLQTELLLEEAIEKLTSNFMLIHQSVQARQQSINSLLAGGTVSEQERAQLAGMGEEIGGYVNAAVTSMQFQDMTAQLLDRTLKRVTGLREFLGTLGVHGADLVPESGNEEIVDLIGKVSMTLAIQSLELRSELRKAVNQKHLESGDIELF